MKRLATGMRMDRRLAVLETFIVFAVVATIVAVAMPAYAARARESVLQQNAHSLTQDVRGGVVLDLDSAYVPVDEAAEAVGAEASLSMELAGTLQCGDAGSYVNPLSGSATVVCETALPSTTDGGPPAVWITDNQSYSYSAFNASVTSTRYLRGTLLIVFITRDGRTGCLEVFYVDAAGKKSSTAAVLGIGA